MNPGASPFHSGQPAPIELFVGRSAEIERLRGLVRRSARGTLGVGFVTGERGIGKSSLAALVRHLAEHDSDVVGCHVYLGGIDEVPKMLRRTFHRLLNESIDKPWHRQLTSFLGNRIEKASLFGLDLKLTRNELETLARDFVPAIRNLLKSLPEPKRTILLVLDDINGLAKSEAFAHWLKSSVDEFATSASEGGASGTARSCARSPFARSRIRRGGASAGPRSGPAWRGTTRAPWTTSSSAWRSSERSSPTRRCAAATGSRIVCTRCTSPWSPTAIRGVAAAAEAHRRPPGVSPQSPPANPLPHLTRPRPPTDHPRGALKGSARTQPAAKGGPA